MLYKMTEENVPGTKYVNVPAGNNNNNNNNNNNLRGGKGPPGRKANNLTAICEPIV
jgi:hypothetical protein